jgi:hypothetical protein
MDEHTSPAPRLTPSLRRRLIVGALSPFVGAVAATLLVRIQPLTSIAAVAGALIPAAAARSFVLALHVSSDRSPLHAPLGMMYDHVPPRRLQRWYVPVIGAAVAAGVSEVLQMLVSFSRGGLHSSIALMLVQFAIGAVDGSSSLLCSRSVGP